MPATYVSSAATAVAGGVATINATIPAGNAGDLLLAGALNGNATGTWTATGWTLGTMVSGSVPAWRRADGTEAATMTFTRGTNTNGFGIVVILRYSGAGLVAAMIASANTSTTSTTVVLQSITSTAANSDIVQIVAKHTGGTQWTPPATATERVEGSTTGSVARYAGGDEILAVAGATGTRAWSRDAVDTGTSSGVMFAVSPMLRRLQNIRTSDPATARSYRW